MTVTAECTKTLMPWVWARRLKLETSAATMLETGHAPREAAALRSVAAAARTLLPFDVSVSDQTC
jgi:hypothetical protein